MLLNHKVISLILLGLLASESFSQTDPLYPVTENRDGILVFKTFDDIQTVVAKLQDEFANNVKSAEMTPETDAMSDEETYKQFMNAPSALGNFERTLGFNSLRMKLEADQKALYEKFGDSSTPRDFVDKIMDDPAADPINHFVDNPFHQSLLNEYLEIVVGDSFYRAGPDGLTDYGSYDKLIASRPLTKTTPQTSTVPLKARLLQSTNPFCTSNKSRSSTIIFGSNRAVVCKVAHTSWPSLTISLLKWANAQTSNYIKVKILFWSFWIPTVRMTTSRVYGFVSGSAGINSLESKTCKIQTVFNPSLSSFTFPWFSVNHLIFVNGFTLSKWVRGFHSASPVPAFNSVLTF